MKKKYFTKEEERTGHLARNAAWRVLHRDEHLARRRRIARSIGQQFSTLKSRAKRDGIEITITFDKFQRLRALPCDYCGGALPEVGYGIDRKNNSKGYTSENSVPCCYQCNTMKGAYLTYDEMKLIWVNRKESYGIRSSPNVEPRRPTDRRGSEGSSPSDAGIESKNPRISDRHAFD